MKILRVVSVMVILTTALAALITLNGKDAAGEAFAEFTVANMTCGSCVQNIQTSLRDVPGVSTVEVSVTTGRGRVSFDPAQTDETAIAEKITASGYPARVNYVLSAQENRALKEEENRLAGKFIARIGTRLIAREDFQEAVEMQRRRSSSQGAEQSVMRSTWERLLQREILLLAAEKNGIVVQEGEIKAEMERMRAAMPGFKNMIAQRYGSVQSFSDTVKTDMTIRRLVEEEVLTGEEDPATRNLKLQNWYAEQAAATEIRILDPQLKAAMSQGGGCGGACCG